MKTISEAIEVLSRKGCVIRDVSRFYLTPCFPVGFGPDYVNAAFSMHCDADERQVLAVLHEVEQAFSRQRVQRWGQRTLDLDLIGRGDVILPDADLVQQWIDLPVAEQTEQTPDQLLLPHPRMQDRAFVLVPLMDIAPDWVHPITSKTVRQMHAELSEVDRNAVKPLVNGEEGS